MAGENEFLLHALYMGIFITFDYDLLRVFRRVVPHRDFFVSAEDLFFWVYCAGEVFLLMYRESNGTLRWFAVTGALTGMFLYRRLVSPFFVKYASRAIAFVLGILGKALKLLSRPFKRLLRAAEGSALRTGRKASGFFGRILRSAKLKLTYYLKKLKMTIKT